MNHTALKTAIAEAKRFLLKAEHAERGFDANPYTENEQPWTNNDTTATAAAKRASMDLTRALAAMRRP